LLANLSSYLQNVYGLASCYLLKPGPVVTCTMSETLVSVRCRRRLHLGVWESEKKTLH